MDKTPQIKSKQHREKMRGSNDWHNESPSRSNVTTKDVSDLQLLPLSPEVRKTPLKSASKFEYDQNSPLFRVGWNDSSSSKTDLEIDSPVSTMTVQRKIRRCPDASQFKLPKKQTEHVNDCNIIQCINWAKNLSGSANSDVENAVSDNESAKSNESTKVDIIDDLLDDSLTEAMVLCSQAVEQSFPVASVQMPDSSATNVDKKHFSTPPQNWKMKRRKIDDQSNSDDGIDVSSNASVCGDSDARTEKINVSTKNEVDASRKSVNKLNFSCKSKSTIIVTEMESISRLTEKTEVESLSNTHSKKDPISSELEEEEDFFCSLDLGFVEQTKKVICDQNSNRTCLPKYTKEQIERKRLEAKKKLMFKKKTYTL